MMILQRYGAESMPLASGTERRVERVIPVVSEIFEPREERARTYAVAGR